MKKLYLVWILFLWDKSGLENRRSDNYRKKKNYNDDRKSKQVYICRLLIKTGYGSQIMDYVETEIAKKHDIAILDVSLPAVCLYEYRGYKTVGHGICELKNYVKLIYEIMEKKLNTN